MSVRVAWTRKRDEVGLPGWILSCFRVAFLIQTKSSTEQPPAREPFFFASTAVSTDWIRPKPEQQTLAPGRSSDVVCVSCVFRGAVDLG